MTALSKLRWRPEEAITLEMRKKEMGKIGKGGKENKKILSFLAVNCGKTGVKGYEVELEFGVAGILLRD